MNESIKLPPDKMRRTLFIILLVSLLAATVIGQRNRRTVKKPSAVTGNSAVIIDERLSVMRRTPGLRTPFVKRLRLGTRISVFDEQKAEGVTFYKVADPTAGSGWVQGEAFAGTFRKGDDQKLVNLVLASQGFTKIHRATIFLDVFEKSDLRPLMLLLHGDLIEVAADEISQRATENLNRREVGVTRAPIHSFYLNYKELDDYLRIGISFVFNADTKMLHYNGASWYEILRKHEEAEETIEARERIKSLNEKMDRKASK